MFEKINNRINTSFETVIPRRVEEIIETLLDKSSESYWYSFLNPTRIDSKEFKISGNVIEITRAPITFSPFRPYGKIRIHLSKGDKHGTTKVKCEVLPGNNNIPIFYAVLLFIQVLFALAFYLMAWRLDLLTKLLVCISVIGVPSLIFYVKYRIKKRDLIDYSWMIIRMMRG